MEISDTDFNEAIAEGIVVIDFWAPWCGPCVMLSPIIEELEKEFEGKIKIYKLNVDESPQTAGAYRVMSIPTIMIFKDGTVQETIVGVQNKQAYADAFAKYVG